MRVIPLILFVITTGFLQAQEPIGTIAFYNLENLFDTEDDPKTNDSEYLPGGRYEWTVAKYSAKLTNMARVLRALPGPPDIVGVCEVENRKVLVDLVNDVQLKPYGYQVLHFDSPDYRGVDVGLLYNPRVFIPFYSENIKIEDPEEKRFLTRDILYAKGLYNGDTLNVFVNHWPSRRGGKEDKRLLVAGILKNRISKIQETNPEAKIIIMGDLNDDPRNKSVKKVLDAHNSIGKFTEGSLYNASSDLFQKGYGTLMYRGAWNMFDQIIVSQSLLRKNSTKYFYVPNSFQVFAERWMQVQDGNDKGAPFRTHSFGVYQNGFSDHYPTFIILGK